MSRRRTNQGNAPRPERPPQRQGGAAADPSATRRADPHYARECERYEQPLPSREYVLEKVTAHGVPAEFDQLCAMLDIVPDERALFERRLGAMERDGQLMRNRRGAYLLPDKADLIRGRIEGHPDGYGFLIRDGGGADIFIGPKEMREVLHGDRAIVRVVGTDRRGRPEGKLVEVLERANTRVVGRVIIEHGVTLVVPENRRIGQDVLLAPGGRKKVAAGQVVTVELVEQPTRYAQPIGKVVEVLGNYADPGMEIEIALRKHELPFEFPKAANEQTRRLPDEVRKTDWKGREDLTALPLVTIDGETARDFDDAVYCERDGRGFRLVVAIADVSHYVQQGSALDTEAMSRGNSVYFPRRVIPMLPEKLSNGLCSLNPKVERLAMVCDMSIAQTGAIKSHRFYRAVIHSHARLTYNQVAAALFEQDAAALETVGALLPHLENLDRLFRVLLKARGKRGAIDFETVETRMIFDDNGKIECIVPEVRNDAHRIIEECMLAANVCASNFLQEHDHAALYRIHAGPSEDRLEKLRGFMAEFGLQLGGGDEPHAKDYAKLLEQVKTRPDMQLLQTVMLRSLKQAMYSPDNVGHFGLAYEAYTHFTSPIRRYPDLLVHRAIKAVLDGKQYAPGDWEEIGLHCSMTERRADEATRDVVAWLKCFYMQDRIGEEFEGSVSAVVPFGLFVALDDIFVEGLVHISDLGQDYFHYDETRHELLGERTGKSFRLSDRVRVQLARVDMETNKIDFRLLEGTGRPTERKGKTGRDQTARRSDDGAPPAAAKTAAPPADEPELQWRELYKPKPVPESECWRPLPAESHEQAGARKSSAQTPQRSAEGGARKTGKPASRAGKRGPGTAKQGKAGAAKGGGPGSKRRR
jgi:ribonuclease R